VVFASRRFSDTFRTQPSTDPSTDPQQEIAMTNETKQPFADPTPDEKISEQEAKDFFPPGTGWNHAKKPDYPGKFRDLPGMPVDYGKN
jgi:hypothetical protein